MTTHRATQLPSILHFPVFDGGKVLYDKGIYCAIREGDLRNPILDGS